VSDSVAALALLVGFGLAHFLVASHLAFSHGEDLGWRDARARQKLALYLGSLQAGQCGSVRLGASALGK
jgi:hypothetical protein